MSRIKGTPSDGSDFEREVGVSQPLELRGLSFVGIAAILVVIVFFGCGKKQDQQPSSLPVSDKALPPMVVDPTTAGSISGGAFLDGSLPVIRPVDMGSEPACAKANSSPATDVPVLAGDGGALANVVVYVKGGLASHRFDSPRQPAVLDQKGCMYEPRVVALMTNQPLEIRNDDATIHNVHAMAKANGEWNKAQRAGSCAAGNFFRTPGTGYSVHVQRASVDAGLRFRFRSSLLFGDAQGREVCAQQSSARHLHDRSMAREIRNAGPKGDHWAARVKDNLVPVQVQPDFGPLVLPRGVPVFVVTGSGNPSAASQGEFPYGRENGRVAAGAQPGRERLRWFPPLNCRGPAVREVCSRNCFCFFGRFPFILVGSNEIAIANV